MSKLKIIIAAICLAMFGAFPANAQYHWTNLKGPYWVNGVDVAVGLAGGDEEWYRYLTGNNGSGSEVFHWNESELNWLRPTVPPGFQPDRLISYKVKDDYDIAHGNVAFCTSYGNDIFTTSDGGDNWRSMGFDQNNKQFTCIALPSYIGVDAPLGDVVMVGCQAMANQPASYYTVDGGQNWDQLGSFGSSDINVNDIESFPEEAPHPWIAAGTSDGIYVKAGDAWSDPWDFAAFSGINVPALESIGQLPDLEQIAAVDEDGVDRCNLYYSTANPPWSQPQEIKFGGESFGRKVNDLAAFYWGNSHISCYAATDEGLYLISFTTPSMAEYVNLNYTPLLYDTDVKAVDYRFLDLENADDTAYVLATTRFGTYEIKESQNDQGSRYIKVSEIVTGTYLANVVSLSLPKNEPDEPIIFPLTDKGIVKKSFNLSEGTLVGLAFEANQSGYLGTDISSFCGTNGDINVVASSRKTNDGRIMHSTDSGISWQLSTIDGEEDYSAINTVGFQIGSTQPNYCITSGDLDEAYNAADYGAHYSHYGQSFSNTMISSDALLDPYSTQLSYSYVCGHGNLKAVMTTGFNLGWTTIENGLSNVSSVNQLAKNSSINWLFAATDIGVFKAYIGVTPVAWSQRTNGIGVQNLGSIVADFNNEYAFLAASSPNALQPQIWASGDSGRSWIELPLGDIPSDCHINMLATSTDNYSGFAVGTDVGAFYLGDIFESGTLADDKTWGPGTIIINGDVTVQGGVTLTIEPGTTVLFNYGFDCLYAGSSTSKSELIVNGTLVAEGESDNPIVFTSSNSTGAAGHWYGIRGESGGSITMNYCQVEYADYGIRTNSIATLSVENSHISHCTSTGVYVNTPQGTPEIKGCRISNNPTYGIYCYLGDISVISDTIENAAYGINYTGAGSSPEFTDCLISFTNGAATSYYGIRAIRSGANSIIPTIDSDTIYGYASAGIYISGATSSGIITNTKVVHCSTNGIYFTYSSVQVNGGSSPDKNLITDCSYGLYLSSSSSPLVTRTKFLDNKYRGIQVGSGCTPDIGAGSGGYNAFMKSNPSTAYYHVDNCNNITPLPAPYNFWSPLGSQYVCNVTQPYPLINDPCPRIMAPENTAQLADDFSMASAYPNPFNPSTAISFNLIIRNT